MMRTKEKKDRADKFADYVFVAGAIISLAAFAIWAVTGHPQPAVRIFATAFWLMFATMNGNVFYTGRFKWKGGPTLTREDTPGMFFLSAICFAVGSTGISTFLLWAAYFS